MGQKYVRFILFFILPTYRSQLRSTSYSLYQQLHITDTGLMLFFEDKIASSALTMLLVRHTECVVNECIRKYLGGCNWNVVELALITGHIRMIKFGYCTAIVFEKRVSDITHLDAEYTCFMWRWLFAEDGGKHHKFFNRNTFQACANGKGKQSSACAAWNCHCPIWTQRKDLTGY